MRALTLLRQPRRRQRLVLEATRELTHAWWLVRRRQFRTFSDRLGRALPGEYVLDVPFDPATLREVRWAVIAVNRTFGGRFTCLMQGMAGKAMLSRRGVSNTLVLGAKLGGSSPSDTSDGMAAHAWLRAGPVVLLGGEERPGFVPVTSYHTDVARG